MRRLAIPRAATLVAIVLMPVVASAHHGDEEGGGFGGMILWVAAGVALGVIAVLQWVATRRRRGQDADSE